MIVLPETLAVYTPPVTAFLIAVAFVDDFEPSVKVIACTTEVPPMVIPPSEAGTPAVCAAIVIVAVALAEAVTAPK